MRAFLTIFLLIQAALLATASPVPAADPDPAPAPAPEADKGCKDTSPECHKHKSLCFMSPIDLQLTAACAKTCGLCK